MNEILSFAYNHFSEKRHLFWLQGEDWRKLVNNVNHNIYFAVLSTGMIGDRSFITDTAFEFMDWYMFP